MKRIVLQKTPLHILTAYIVFLFHPFFSLYAEVSCIYMNENGVIREVRSKKQIPAHLLSRAKCFEKSAPSRGEDKKTSLSLPNKKAAPGMASPSEVNLTGLIRKERISTPIGPMNIRYSRSAEKILGKNPIRATAEAARMVSRALKQEGFPAHISRLEREWQVVFMDSKVPATQIPSHLVTNCHPAWMTPPSNIYMVVDRAVKQCGGGSDITKELADARIAQVLAHEIGHVVEHSLLGDKMSRDRARAEGFATWFEAIASDYSTLIPKESVLRQHKSFAKASYARSPDSFIFRGSAGDYSRASMYFHAVVRDRGVKEIIRIYKDIKSERYNKIRDAILQSTGWSEGLLEKKIKKIIGG